MERFYSNDLQCEVQQIQKRTARKLYDAGKTIYLHPCNMRFDNAWQTPMPANRNQKTYDWTFDILCDDYKYYNCDYERGYYIRFYVKVTDLQN
jgi:hypothetical protein